MLYITKLYNSRICETSRFNAALTTSLCWSLAFSQRNLFNFFDFFSVISILISDSILLLNLIIICLFSASFPFLRWWNYVISDITCGFKRNRSTVEWIFSTCWYLKTNWKYLWFWKKPKTLRYICILMLYIGLYLNRNVLLALHIITVVFLVQEYITN